MSIINSFLLALFCSFVSSRYGKSLLLGMEQVWTGAYIALSVSRDSFQFHI